MTTAANERKVWAWALFWATAVGAFVLDRAQLELAQKFFALGTVVIGVFVLQLNRFSWIAVILVVIGLVASMPGLPEAAAAFILWSINGFAP